MTWLEYGGRLRKLPEGSVVIGSGSEATLCIEDLDLMPRHLVIEPGPEHVTLCAFSPDVVVALDHGQIGTEQCPVAYGAPILVGAGVLRIWRDRPAQRLTPPLRFPPGWLVRADPLGAYPLDRPATCIGRSSDNQVRLGDPTASRFHAQIRREAGGYALHVTGSAGGTVNGLRVSSPRLLKDGDVVELAHAAFTFTHGHLPPGVPVLPIAADEDGERAERPTVLQERVSLATGRISAPPRILSTAIVLGGLVAAVVIAWLLLA